MSLATVWKSFYRWRWELDLAVSKGLDNVCVCARRGQALVFVLLLSALQVSCRKSMGFDVYGRMAIPRCRWAIALFHAPRSPNAPREPNCKSRKCAVLNEWHRDQATVGILQRLRKKTGRPRRVQKYILLMSNKFVEESADDVQPAYHQM